MPLRTPHCTRRRRPPRARSWSRSVGTSGAYGGSNSAEWNDFRDAWSDLGSGHAGTGGDTGESGPSQPSDQLFEPTQPASDLDRVGQALINALWRDDPATRGNVVPTIPRPRVPGRRGAGAGGAAGAGGTGGGSAGAGRSGSRSTRQVEPHAVARRSVRPTRCGTATPSGWLTTACHSPSSTPSALVLASADSSPS